MILRIFLMFCKSEPRDSYKNNSYKNSVQFCLGGGNEPLNTTAESTLNKKGDIANRARVTPISTVYIVQ